MWCYDSKQNAAVTPAGSNAVVRTGLYKRLMSVKGFEHTALPRYFIRQYVAYRSVYLVLVSVYENMKRGYLEHCSGIWPRIVEYTHVEDVVRLRRVVTDIDVFHKVLLITTLPS